MKKILLILILSLGMPSALIAGGDDRDQQLPLNSLNTEQISEDDEAPRFLEDTEEVAKDETIQKGREEIEGLIQSKISSQESIEAELDGTAVSTDVIVKTRLQLFIDRYIKSDQGILLMLFLFVIGLILMFNFFVREK
jgi:hypothetical protein